ncbi:MAG: hypothetical protein GXY07_17915 [Candidatus Hydrogenedentes bacterium]|nr:hypothetical protein [Candidatus Hydrogenedentota bacterium]
MAKSIQELIQELNDKTAGWATRRDAVETLGKYAHRLVTELLNHQQEEDMDVQMEVERSLQPLHVLLETPGKTQKQYTLRELALACERHGHRTVDTYKTGFVVTVKLEEGRSHRVYIMPNKSTESKKIIRLFTLCGEASPEMLSWALKANAKLTHAAFSILTFDDEEQLAIINNILKEDATPALIKRGVKEMAFYGDWLEEKLSDRDIL